MTRIVGFKIKLNIVLFIWTLSSAGQSNRLITGRSWVRTPERPLLFFGKQTHSQRLLVETEFIFSAQPGSTPKACEARDAALPQNWQVTGRSWVRIPESVHFFNTPGCSIFCTTTPYNFCISLLSHSICCSVCCGCFIIYKKQQ